MSDRPEIEIQRQTAFGDDGQLEVTETSVETSLEDFGADVDHRDRDSRLDQPEACEFGVDDRPARIQPMEMNSTTDPRAVVQDASERWQASADCVEYVGMRVDGTPVVLNLTAHERLSPNRSLGLVRHSPAGFDWGYTGSGPAQLACALLLDYTDNETVAQQHYIQFRNDVVSQLVCDGPADCWHLTGEDIEAALAEFEEYRALTPDGGTPSSSLPANWSAVSRTDRTVFQRRDIDHYVVLAEGSEEWLIILCAQGDRAYPAPLDHRTLPVENHPASAVQALVAESNDLVEPEEDI